MLGLSRIQPDFTKASIIHVNLRTVIVTAAVHRGFSSGLPEDCSPMTPLFNLPAPGRRQPLYVVFDLAETCVFVKQSPYALHCGPLAWALLLPKLRSQFAEFLNEPSLERLWIFSSSTCVGLGYGSLCSP